MCSLKSFLAKIFLGNFLLFNSLKILLIFLFTLHLLNALLIDLQPDQPLNPVDAVEIRLLTACFELVNICVNHRLSACILSFVGKYVSTATNEDSSLRAHFVTCARRIAVRIARSGSGY